MYCEIQNINLNYDQGTNSPDTIGPLTEEDQAIVDTPFYSRDWMQLKKKFPMVSWSISKIIKALRILIKPYFNALGSSSRPGLFARKDSLSWLRNNQAVPSSMKNVSTTFIEHLKFTYSPTPE